MTPEITNQLYKQTDKKNLYATVLIVLTVLIAFFLTSGLYSKYVELSAQSEDITTKKENLVKEVDDLNRKKTAVEDKKVQEVIKQYA
jgi:hypothetical protein